MYKRQLYENTVIVFTSDHGDMCGSHRMTDKHYVLYDDVVRVPLLVHIPGQAGKDCADYVINSLDPVSYTHLDVYKRQG